MKKTLLIILAVILIGSAVVYDSLAVYSTTETLTAEVGAKRLVLSLEKSTGFDRPFKIAPTESVEFIFTLANYEGSNVTEVPIDATVTVSVKSAQGKNPIGNLTATIYKNDEKLADINLINGEGWFTFERYLGLDEELDTYMVVIYWPSCNDDIKYMGDGFGNIVEVKATGVQSTGEPPETEEPEDPHEPEQPISDAQRLAKELSINLANNASRIFEPGRYTINYNINNNGKNSEKDYEATGVNDVTRRLTQAVDEFAARNLRGDYKLKVKVKATGDIIEITVDIEIKKEGNEKKDTGYSYLEITLGADR
jgi:hypothetical protein